MSAFGKHIARHLAKSCQKQTKSSWATFRPASFLTEGEVLLSEQKENIHSLFEIGV